MTLCGYCGRDASDVCDRCGLVAYCSVSCQKQDWQTHKTECKELISGPRLFGYATMPHENPELVTWFSNVWVVQSGKYFRIATDEEESAFATFFYNMDNPQLRERYRTATIGKSKYRFTADPGSNRDTSFSGIMESLRSGKKYQVVRGTIEFSLPHQSSRNWQSTK